MLTELDVFRSGLGGRAAGDETRIAQHPEVLGDDRLREIELADQGSSRRPPLARLLDDPRYGPATVLLHSMRSGSVVRVINRNEYERSKEWFEEQRRAGLEMIEAAYRAQVRALDLVWMLQGEEGQAVAPQPARPESPPS